MSLSRRILLHPPDTESTSRPAPVGVITHWRPVVEAGNLDHGPQREKMDLERLLALEEDIELRVTAAETGGRLDRVLAGRVHWSTRSAVAGWIRAGRARVDGRPVTRPGRPLREGQRVQLRVVKTPRDLDAAGDPLPAISLVHRGADFVVADKPHGLASHPAGGVLRRTLLAALGSSLQGEYESGGPWLPHRLDRDTGGLSIVALRRTAMVRFSAAFAAGQIRRFYRARVRGRLAVAQDWTDLQFPLREAGQKPKRIAVDPLGLPAHTRVRVLGHAPDEGTRVRLEAVTGRQHQLRVHLAHIGHPIQGDRLYDPEARPDEPLQLTADELWIPAHVCGKSESDAFIYLAER
jgi:23S rRNA pseudouridine1911/1915/1917 synthase